MLLDVPRLSQVHLNSISVPLFGLAGVTNAEMTTTGGTVLSIKTAFS